MCSRSELQIFSVSPLSYEKWAQTVERARQIMSKLHEKHPELRAQPVFSFRGCQMSLTTDIEMILDCLPEMICGEELKHTLALYYQDRVCARRKDFGSKTIAQLNRNIDILEKQLWFKGVTRIDLNTSRNPAGLIPQLLCDPMVDKSLSYFHKPGLARVSLGTVAMLSRR